jgi:hypothetical protein
MEVHSAGQAGTFRLLSPAFYLAEIYLACRARNSPPRHHRDRSACVIEVDMVVSDEQDGGNRHHTSRCKRRERSPHQRRLRCCCSSSSQLEFAGDCKSARHTNAAHDGAKVGRYRLAVGHVRARADAEQAQQQ